MTTEPFVLVKEKMDVYVNLRIEKHGDDNVNGYDIKVSGRSSNSILLKFDDGLRDALYVGDKQADVEGFKKKLRFPLIAKPLHWALEIPRVVVRLHDAANADDDLVITGGDADNFVIDPMEGGTVDYKFRIKCPEMSEEQVMKLLRANGQNFQISMEKAKVEEKKDNFEQVEQGSLIPPSPAREAAESHFKTPAELVAAADPLKADGIADAEQVDVGDQKLDVPAAAPKKRGGGRAKVQASE